MEKYYQILYYMLQNIEVFYDEKNWFIGSIHSDGIIILVKDNDVIEVDIKEIKL